jgi:hypothetical protein
MEVVPMKSSDNGDGFDDFYKEWHRVIWRLARQWTRNTTDAEDIAQEALRVAFLKRHTVQHSRAIYTWLSVIVMRLAAESYRKRDKIPTWTHDFLNADHPRSPDPPPGYTSVDPLDCLIPHTINFPDYLGDLIAAYIECDGDREKVSNQLRWKRGSVNAGLAEIRKRLLDLSGYGLWLKTCESYAPCVANRLVHLKLPALRTFLQWDYGERCRFWFFLSLRLADPFQNPQFTPQFLPPRDLESSLIVHDLCGVAKMNAALVVLAMPDPVQQARCAGVVASAAVHDTPVLDRCNEWSASFDQYGDIISRLNDRQQFAKYHAFKFESQYFPLLRDHRRLSEATAMLGLRRVINATARGAEVCVGDLT